MSEYLPETEIQLPPNTPEEEACAIGCLINEPRLCLDHFSEHLPEGSSALFDGRHRVIFDEVQEAISAGDDADSLSLIRRLRDKGRLTEIGGSAYLSELAGMATTPGLLQVHLQAIREKYVARKAIGIAQNLIESAHGPDDSSEVVERAITSLQECRSGVTSSMTGKDCAMAMTVDLEARQKLQGQLTGIATGFASFDKKISGLQRGEQVIIGARPNAGKSAIAIVIGHHACLNNGVPTLFISLEMGVESVMRRMASVHCAGILAFDLRDGKISDHDFRKLTSFASLLSRKPWFFKDGIRGMTSAQITSCIREHVRKHGVKLVIIDYLQKIKPNTRHEKRTYEVGAVSESLLATARDTKVALVTLAQLNRDSVKGESVRAPRVSDLADSGQIDRDGDIICLLHRDPEDESKAGLIVAKTRDGPGGIINLHFEAPRCLFTEVATQEEPPPTTRYGDDN